MFLFLETRRAKLNERSTSLDNAIASASGITRRHRELQKRVTVRDYDIPWLTHRLTSEIRKTLRTSLLLFLLDLFRPVFDNKIKRMCFLSRSLLDTRRTHARNVNGARTLRLGNAL